MNQSDGGPQRGGSLLVWLRLIARVFYPRTLQGVLALIFVVSLLVQLVPPWLADVLSLAILVWFGRVIVIARGDRRQSGRRALGRALAQALGYVVAYFAFAFAVYVGTVFLAFLAGGGTGSGVSDPAWGNVYQGKLGTGEFAALVAIIGLLTWIPNRLFRIRLDMDGTAGVQRVLLWLITAVACIFTGIYILLHFANGPLHTIRMGQLVAGILFTVVLLVPWYGSLARACWTRGFANVASPRLLMRHLNMTATELGTLLTRAAEQASEASERSADKKQAEGGQPPIGQESGSPAATPSVSHFCRGIGHRRSNPLT